MKHTRTLYAVAGLVLGGAAIGYLAGFGPLDPPAGPVEETSPSLADLSAQIAALPLGVGGTGIPADAFVSEVIPSTSLPQNVSVEGLAGPVFLHSIIITNGQVEVLDDQDALITNLNSPSATQTGTVGSAQFDFGLFLDGGVRLRRTSNFNSTITFIYAPLGGG